MSCLLRVCVWLVFGCVFFCCAATTMLGQTLLLHLQGLKHLLARKSGIITFKDVDHKAFCCRECFVG